MNLYEIKYKRDYHFQEGKNSIERLYQILARNKLQACAELGRLFCGEEYQLVILECYNVGHIKGN